MFLQDRNKNRAILNDYFRQTFIKNKKNNISLSHNSINLVLEYLYYNTLSCV